MTNDNFENELLMKERGSERVLNETKNNSGNFKSVISTQTGQNMIFSDCIEILPKIKNWIESKTSTRHRKFLKKYFSCDEKLLSKITETYFILVSSEKFNDAKDCKKSVNKQRYILFTKIQRIVFPDLEIDYVMRFVEILVDLSKYIEKELVKKTGEVNKVYKFTCTIQGEAMRKIEDYAMRSFYPLPMTEKPLNWSYEDEKLIGGYRTKQTDMIRARNKIDYSLYSDKIFDSINYIQSTPWIVNKEVLKEIEKNSKFPIKEDYVKAEYPDAEGCFFEEGLEIKSLREKFTEEEVNKITKARKDRAQAVSLYKAERRDFESAIGKYNNVDLALKIAKMYVDKTIYFPHYYDFRGRIYPSTIGLSPQGSDAVKAMLLYKNVEKLTERGLQWCWAYMASLYGDDKLPFRERVARGKELLNADYKEADEPYQFLSHQLEMKKYVSDNSYNPNVRIHLDACNSGSQFTSAMTGDLKGCLATNVIPTYDENGKQNRQDAYLLVSEKSKELLREDIKNKNNDLDKFLLSLLEENGRKICKRPVMVSNYGGTDGGRKDMLWEMFRELGVERSLITRPNAGRLSDIIGSSIRGVLNGGKAFETYIQQMNTLIAKDDKPVTWTTDDGFYVYHRKSKKLGVRKIQVVLPNSRRSTRLSKVQFCKKRVNSVKMKLAISPNYVHSKDAELLRMTALRMRDYGIENSDWIHDSFGCHPNHVDFMLRATKEEFLKLIKRNPIAKLDLELRSQINTDMQTQRRLSKVKMPYVGNNIDFNKILESDWFFS